MSPNERPEGNGADEPLEPRIDADSKERQYEQILDPPHVASRFEAPNGHGTSDGPPYGQEFQERPVLDGATQSPEAEATVPNPYRGVDDPARIGRQPALNTTNTDRWLIFAIAAAVILVPLQLVLARWSPVWCGVGIVLVLVGLLAMLVIRLTKVSRTARLRADALILWTMWLVPIAIILSVIIGHRDDIWPFRA